MGAHAMSRHAVVVVAIVLAGLWLCGCGRMNVARDEAIALTGGNPEAGVLAIGRHGCGACHEIPGIGSARGAVGPPLGGIAVRSYLAGHLPNSPENMMRWIQHPQLVERGTAMPEMGVTDEEARNITAYLYTLR